MFLVYFILDIFAIVIGWKLIKMVFSFGTAAMDRLTERGIEKIRGGKSGGRRIVLEEDEDGNLYYEE